MKLLETPLAVKSLRLAPPAMVRTAMVLWVTAVCAVMVLLNVSWYRQMQREADLSRYRIAVNDVAGTMRAMSARAVGQRQALELRIDAASGTLSLSIAPRRGRGYARLERTIW
ncbi:MAG: hypothetical protein HY598_03685, partial [Candidatus Omnitrophica bacterium]|nr:hypothetical protein [Candidatus Omnitrophota bacterium]